MVTTALQKSLEMLALMVRPWAGRQPRPARTGCAVPARCKEAACEQMRASCRVHTRDAGPPPQVFFISILIVFFATLMFYAERGTYDAELGECSRREYPDHH